ncbi:MAG: hypothetical protein EPO22_11450 [Dehalococcoidia bacterium]|nr:MAG: hypothetical protein EPO22_11450 [Dehalococcoidia bacterium]
MFLLSLNSPSYRADPVLPGALTREDLRAGMDAQYAKSITDTDADGCPDVKESLLAPNTDPSDPWDFYSVPTPALFAAPNPLNVFKDATVSPGDAQAVFAYFTVGAQTGTPEYEQDRNANGIKDGLEYDRSVAGPAKSGAPDGVITASDAQLAFAQFKFAYHC